MTPIAALQAKHIDYSFGELGVLHDVNIDLVRGAVTAITGPNGAGKSTLLEILAGVRRPLAGSVSMAASAPIALVVQRTTTPDLLPLTVSDVVSMGTWAQPSLHALSSRSRRSTRRTERRRAVAHALDRVGLSFAAGRPFIDLSGGQRQRVLLAQAIVRNAPVLLLDEPATGLDSESRDRTRAILAEEAARGAAVAVVTHDSDTIDVADAIVRLVDGVRVR